MKVIALNGSPHSHGNTYLAIRAVLDEIESQGIETEILHIGGHAVKGCVGCSKCFREGHCIVPDEQFEAWAQKLYDADGVLLAAPAYYGGMPGVMKTFLDRFFYQVRKNVPMRYKVGASIAVLRRSGGITTLDSLNRYFYGSEMLVAPTPCPEIIHGCVPDEVLQDAEGVDTMKKLGRNIAWILKMKEAAQETVSPPPYQERIYMNFIRT
jgi:multimeric flavodoxin WrbA